MSDKTLVFIITWEPKEQTGDSTRQNQMESEHDAIQEAKNKLKISDQINEGKIDPKVYRGEGNYANYIQLSENDIKMKSYKGTLGPLKAPTNVRSTVRFDYMQYLCKDYNEKGYCGYGGKRISRFVHFYS